MHRSNARGYAPVSTTTTDHSSPVPPALEPPKGRFAGHRRSFAGLRAISALVLREMSTTYGRSPGGYVWAILEPLGMILIMSFAFALVMRRPSLGDSFIVFYAAGYLVFAHYKVLEKAISKAIDYSRSLLQYPAVTWLDAIFARLILTLLTNTLNMILIMGGVLYFTGTNTILDFEPIVLSVFLATMLGTGIGTFNCMMSGLVPVWSSIWKIGTRPLMIGSAVLYIYEDLPAQAAQLIWFNPLVHVTALYRSGVFPTYNPEWVMPMYPLGLALAALAVGLFFLNSYASDIITRE